MYGPMTPPLGTEQAGDDQRSERAIFERRLEDMDVDLGRHASDRAYARVRHVANQGGHVSDSQLRAIVDEVVSGAEVFQGVAESFR